MTVSPARPRAIGTGVGGEGWTERWQPGIGKAQTFQLPSGPAAVEP